MVKESWGKKHICPFCGAMFYDMKKEVVVCHKCQKSLTTEDEMKFIEKKKKADVVQNDAMEELGVSDEMDIAESEMFFDMENDETGFGNMNDGGSERFDDEEEDY